MKAIISLVGVFSGEMKQDILSHNDQHNIWREKVEAFNLNPNCEAVFY